MCASLALTQSSELRPPDGALLSIVAPARVRRFGRVMRDSGSISRRDDPWAASVAAIASRRDRAAFAELFGHFAPRVKSYLQRRGASDSQAEEIAQETMLVVWRKAELYDAEAASVATWVFTIARNLRIDAGRRERRGGAIRVSDVEAEFEADETPLADAQLAAAQSEARVRAALKSLSGDQLKVISMSFFEDRAHGEIARTLQIPLGTVKSRLRLAMNRLRGLLDEEL
jgi:RNA polymerase sigma-70 factor (ECF subfamily)